MNSIDRLKNSSRLAVSDVWQQERRIFSVMFEIKGLRVILKINSINAKRFGYS